MVRGCPTADEPVSCTRRLVYARRAVGASPAGRRRRGKGSPKLAAGRREMLVAMATGTGKTRMLICLVYRLLKARRFRRVLFLVDRAALGEQTIGAFKD